MTPVEYARRIPGWMSLVEMGWLSRTAKALPPGATWLEVGTWMGRSWACAALSLPENAGIIAVDTFDGGTNPKSLPYKQVRKRGKGVLADFIRIHQAVKRVRPDLATQIIIAPSVRAAILVPDESCDVIFIDGDHRKSEVIADVTAWLPKVKPGGLLCGHDTDDPEVMKALAAVGLAIEPADLAERGCIWCHRIN